MNETTGGTVKGKKVTYIRLKRAGMWKDPYSDLELNRWQKPWTKVPDDINTRGVIFGIAANRIEAVTKKVAESTRPTVKIPRLKMTRDRQGMEPEGDMVNDPAYLMIQPNREQEIIIEIRKEIDLDLIERALNYEQMAINTALDPRPGVVEAFFKRVVELKKKKGISDVGDHVGMEESEILQIG